MAVRTKAARDLLQQARLNRLRPNLERIAEIKRQIEELGVELETLEREAFPVLNDYDKTWTINNCRYTATQGTQTIWDEKGLRSTLGEQLWEMVRKESIDTKKLGAAVTAGLVSAETVAEFAEIKKKKPYILVTYGDGASAEAA